MKKIFAAVAALALLTGAAVAQNSQGAGSSNSSPSTMDAKKGTGTTAAPMAPGTTNMAPGATTNMAPAKKEADKAGTGMPGANGSSSGASAGSGAAGGGGGAGGSGQ